MSQKPLILARDTDARIEIRRVSGKIALEEAVGSPIWNANETYPATPLIDGFDGLPFTNQAIQDIAKRLNDVNARLESMDRSGISYALLSLTSPGIEGIADKGSAIDYARRTNDWIHEKYVQAYPDRFGFFCCAPLQDPEAAAKEVERCVNDLGAKGVLVNGFSNVSSEAMNTVQYMDDQKVEPFWTMLAKLDVPLYLHPRNPPVDQQRLYNGYPSLAQAGFAFTPETAGHALRIMCSGVLDRYPNIKIILGHCGEALPFMIHRIDQRMGLGDAGLNGPHKKTMMEYFQQNFYATCAGVRRESTLKCTIEELGESRVMFSVDYPFESNEEASDWFDGLAMNDNTKRALASGNAKRLFKLP